MLLAIDAGNSTVSFGFFDGEALAQVFTAESRPGATPDEYRGFLRGQMAGSGISPGSVTGVVVSSVVPGLARTLFESLQGMGGPPPLLVSPRLKLGVSVRYDTPETLGSDRIAAAAAAYGIYGGPVIVADCGTATTLSAVDGGGAFVGGAIAPGLMTGYEALVRAAPPLARAGLTYPKGAIGRSTAEGIHSGVILGHAGMMDGLLDAIRAELKCPARAVVTGGLAGMVTPHLRGPVDVEPHLVLKGLIAIHRINREG